MHQKAALCGNGLTTDQFISMFTNNDQQDMGMNRYDLNQSLERELSRGDPNHRPSCSKVLHSTNCATWTSYTPQRSFTKAMHESHCDVCLQICDGYFVPCNSTFLNLFSLPHNVPAQFTTMGPQLQKVWL